MNLVIPNLAELGVARRSGQADLETIIQLPYPVIRPYRAACAELGWEPFGGGTWSVQGSKVGVISSGYRAETLNGNVNSPHRFGIALDVLVSLILEDLVKAAKVFGRHFQRVGIYPERGFLHVDQAPENWIERYKKKASWVHYGGVYHSFANLRGSLLWIRENIDPNISP